MDRTIRQITDELIKRLPDDNQYYRLDELQDWGFPVFIIKRIRLELERNLADSMRLPETDWADIQSETVRSVWQQFVDAIRAEARLPASYARTVTETAVADVLEMLVQPRKSLPDVVFGADEKLNFEEVKARSEAIVVYPHFAKLIPRYMQRREMDTLSRERCASVVAKADEKLTSHYSPLNWAQMLDPLFSLLGGSIDTNLLRLFFEDKKMPRVARRFDLMSSSVNRAKLIEVLSSPELLNFEGYEEDQSDLFDVEKARKMATEELRKSADLQEDISSGGKAEKSRKKEKQADTPGKKEAEANKEPEGDTEEILSEADPVDTFHKSRKEKEKQPETAPDVEKADDEDEGEDEENSLNAVFAIPEDEDSQEVSEEESPGGLNDIFREEDEKEEGGEAEKKEEIEIDRGKEKARNNGTEEETEVDKDAVNDSETSPPFIIDEDEAAEEGEEKAMWQRFMSPEDLARYEEEQETLGEAEAGEDEENVDEDGFIDEPIIDLTKKDQEKDELVAELRKQLQSDRDYFIEKIFGGSDRAYEEALEQIAGKEDWRSASKFIEKDVFKRNLIDMYSEAAVDFTDRLQTFFIQKSKS